MEEYTKRIIEIEVETDAAIKSFQELGQQIAENKKKMDELDKSSTTYDEDLIKLQQENKVLAQQMRSVEKEIQNNIKRQKAEQESLVDLRAKLSNLNKQYDSMSGMDRMAEKGQKLQAEIKSLSDQISGLEANTGRYQRNVGNYKSALEGLSTSFKTAGLSTSGFDKSLKLLNANPIILFLTAIVAVIKAVIDSFKRNEDATMGLREALSGLNPIVDTARKVMDGFAKVIVGVVTAAVNGLTTAIGWLMQRFQDAINLFGGDAHFADNFKAGVAAANELQEAENEYIKHKREWSVEAAKIDRDVADLREKASQKDQYNAQQRLEFLDQAIELETKKAAKEKELAEENLVILQREAKRSKNAAEMNDKLAEAERAVIEADKQLSDTKRSLSRQRQAAISEIGKHTVAVKADTAAIKENNEELKRQEEYRKLTINEMQKAEDAINNLISDEFEKRRAIENTNFHRKEEQLLANLEAEKNEHGESTALYIAYYNQLEALREQHDNNMLAIENDRIAKEQAAKDAAEKKNAERIKKEIELEYSKYEGVAKVTGAISDLLEAAGDENEGLVRASKIAALAEVAIQQGVAIAKAVQSAAGIPFPANIPSIATAVAAVLTTLSTAVETINSVKLARGTDYVKGPGTSTSDSVPAMLSVGEGVANAKANAMFPGVVGAMNEASFGNWAPMLNMLANSNGAPAHVTTTANSITELQMGAAFRAAIADLNIAVSVEEINRVGQQVNVVENLATI